MSIKSYKPTTPGRRHASVVDTSHLSKKRPEKNLLVSKKRPAGRNNKGKITVRHRGGGHKRFVRIIDNIRQHHNDQATVMALEYDPNRTAHLALVQYPDGDKRYIVAPEGLKVGDKVLSSPERAEIKIGNRLPLSKLPIGIMVYDLEIQPGSGAQMVRSAGAGAIIQALEGDYAQIKLPSGEVRLFHKDCCATIGQVSNVDHFNIRLGKAGKKRWMGIKPSVRGKAMNPVDHPHGGGEGHNPIGMKHPKTPWGKPALGVRTRKAGKYSDKFIVKKRV
jgi:large subunit ribosomal protein L2